MMANTYDVPLTGPQLRVLSEVLGAVLSGPEWADFTGPRDWETLRRADDTINDYRRTAQRAASTPA